MRLIASLRFHYQQPTTYVVDNPICSTDPLGLLGESVSNWVQEKLYDAAEYLRQKVGDVTKHFTNEHDKCDGKAEYTQARARLSSKNRQNRFGNWYGVFVYEYYHP